MTALRSICPTATVHADWSAQACRRGRCRGAAALAGVTLALLAGLGTGSCWAQRSGTPARPWVDPLRASELDRLGEPQDRRPLSLGLDFKPAVSPALGVVRGTVLKMQLDNSSAVALRVRGRGVQLAYRSEF